ncbi:TlpA family protein disulfide reductase [Nakamurella silvestris]|nr:TlpA family protein disulfide reductase [Nakamurella silvestris]
MSRRIRGVFAAVLAGMLLLSACSSPTTQVGSFYFTSPGGKTAFEYPAAERGTIGEFSGPDLTGDGTISVTDFRGQVLVVNYWGAWCEPCRDEVDDLNYAYESTKDLGVAFLGVNVAEPRQSGLDFAVEKKVPYPSIWDQGRRTMLAFRGLPSGTTPVTIILDRDQKVARIFLGGITIDQLAPAIKAVAAEQPVSGSGSTAPSGSPGAGAPSGAAAPSDPADPTAPATS